MTENNIGFPTFLVYPRNRSYPRIRVRKQKRNGKPKKLEGEKAGNMMFEKEEEREEIKRDEVSPKEDVNLIQRSREQCKSQLSLKDNNLYQKLSMNVSLRVRWMLRWECNCMHDESAST